MQHSRKRITVAGPIVGLAILTAIAFGAPGLVACGGKPLHPDKWQEPPTDTMDGPGLLSGDGGEWILHND